MFDWVVGIFAVFGALIAIVVVILLCAEALDKFKLWAATKNNEEVNRLKAQLKETDTERIRYRRENEQLRKQLESGIPYRELENDRAISIKG